MNKGTIFISYVEEDSTTALRLVEELQSAGYSTWYYERDSKPGTSYLLQESLAIKNSLAIALIISPDSLHSPQITAEVVKGHEYDKPFIPILKNISFQDFQTEQPVWRDAMGATAGIVLNGEILEEDVFRLILAGIEKINEIESNQESDQESRSLRSVSAHPNNLPIQPTPFVGREVEVASIIERIREPSCRLLTLVGPGGIGKTRLGLQAAAEVIEDYRDGAYFVPLASIPSTEYLVSTIADSLNFSFYGQQNPKVQLLNYLREKQMLLVMDNFEHIVDGAANVADILSAAPELRIIVTSRERLQLPGEWLYEVDGMSFPERTDVEDLQEYGAGQLFLQTARRAHAGFDPSEADKQAIARICQMVQGMPIGIELASAWINVLSCREIAEEIESSIGFLETSMRDVPERHKSIRAVFDHSWNLLSDAERAVYSKMSVFKGGFQRKAAERVVGASLLQLSSLVNKSLLRRSASGRYEMLGVLMQIAEEKLDEAGEEKEMVLDSLSTYLADLLHSQEERLIGSQQSEALQSIGEEIENIRVAWTWAISTLRIEELDKSVLSLFRFYEMRGRYQEGENAFGRAADSLETATQFGDTSESTELLIARIRGSQGVLNFRLGEPEKSRDLIRSSVDVFRRLDDQADAAFFLTHLGLVVRMLGDYGLARQHLEESLAMGRLINVQPVIAQSLHNLGVVAFSRGEYEEARRLYQQSLAIRREIGEQHGMALSLNNLGNVSVVLGDLPESRDLFVASQDIFDQIGNRWGVATCLSNLANVDSRLGHFEDATQVYESSLQIYREIGDRWGTANCLVGWGEAACELGMHDEAEGHLKEALSIAKAINAVPLIIHGVAGMAALLTRRGRSESAEELIAIVLAHPAAEGEAREQVQMLLEGAAAAARLEAIAGSIHNPEASLDQLVQRLLVDQNAQSLSRNQRASEYLR